MFTSSKKDKKYMSKGGKTTAKRYGLKYMRKIARIAGKRSAEVKRAKREVELAKLAKLSTGRTRLKGV